MSQWQIRQGMDVDSPLCGDAGETLWTLGLDMAMLGRLRTGDGFLREFDIREWLRMSHCLTLVSLFPLCTCRLLFVLGLFVFAVCFVFLVWFAPCFVLQVHLGCFVHSSE